MTQAAKLLLLIVLREIRSNKNTLSNDKDFEFSWASPSLWDRFAASSGVCRSQRERVSEREFRDRITTQKDNEMKIKQKTVTKMGRPAIGKRAMTASERQQRYRDRIKREAQALLQQVKLY